VTERRSTASLLDDWLLAVVVVAAVLIGLRVVGWVTGLVFFFVKVAILAAVVVVAVRVTKWARRSSVDR
jgi:hypothetical protein